MVILERILLVLCLFLAGTVVYFKWKERRLLARLQRMLEEASSGTFADRHLDASQLSLLENSMWRYLCDNRLAYLELLEQKENLQKLISDIAHQAATPVTNVILYTQLLEEELAQEETASSCSAQEGLHAILEQAEKTEFFIRLLVKLSRLEQDLIHVNPVRQRIEPVLSALKQQYALKASEKGITLSVTSSSETAVFDRKWTIEAAANLVDNAIKYTPRGGNVSVRAVPYSLFLRLDVIDNGIGIPEQEQGKIFTRFYRSRAVQQELGTGIGLSIARQVMDMQNGYIKLTSEAGKGSTFSLFFLKQELPHPNGAKRAQLSQK